MALFAAGIAMGLAGACMWAWAVHAGQFRDLEATKAQLFWPDLAAPPDAPAPRPVEQNHASDSPESV